MPHLRAWVDDYRRWGLLRTLHKRLMLLVRPGLMVCRVHTRALDRCLSIPPPPDGLTARVASAQDLERAVASEEFDLTREFVAAASQRGDVCVAMFDGDRMVAYVWRSVTVAPHQDGLWVRFRKPYRYGYKSYTHPDYRGRHLIDNIVTLLDPESIEHGFTASIGFVETHNYPSITSDMRRGSSVVGWAGYLRLFGRAYPFRSPGARRHGFAFARRPSDG